MQVTGKGQYGASGRFRQNMFRESSRWLRMLRKELAFQRRQQASRVRGVVLAVVVVSGATALALWREDWIEINAGLDQQLQTSLGLLDLRVNQHKTTVLDWGHWDSMYAFSSGRDSAFIEVN